MTEGNDLKYPEVIDITIEEEILFHGLNDYLFTHYQHVVLYGLSELTAKILHCAHRHQKEKILFIVSDNQNMRIFQGISVKSQTTAPDSADLVIVCASENENEYTQKARSWAGTTPAVFSAIYDSVMLLAHRTTKNIPTGNWPRKMYFLCSSERTGSTMLANLLKRTRVLGTPGEHFRMFLKVQVEKELISYDEILPLIIKNYQTENGIFGVKIHGYQYSLFKHAISGLQQDTRERIHQLTETASYIFLLRKNICRQAISLWRAEYSKTYHIYKQSFFQKWAKGNSSSKGSNFLKYLIQRFTPVTQKKPSYDYSRIKKNLLQVIDERESWMLFFKQREISPLVITYEAFSKNMSETLQEIGKHVGIAIPTEKLQLKPRSHRMADKYTEKIYTAFIQELLFEDPPLANLVNTMTEQGRNTIFNYD